MHTLYCRGKAGVAVADIAGERRLAEKKVKVKNESFPIQIIFEYYDYLHTEVYGHFQKIKFY